MYRAIVDWCTNNETNFDPIGLVVISGDADFQETVINIWGYGHLTVNISNGNFRNRNWELLLQNGYVNYIFEWMNIRP